MARSNFTAMGFRVAESGVICWPAGVRGGPHVRPTMIRPDIGQTLTSVRSSLDPGCPSLHRVYDRFGICVVVDRGLNLRRDMLECSFRDLLESTISRPQELPIRSFDPSGSSSS